MVQWRLVVEPPGSVGDDAVQPIERSVEPLSEKQKTLVRDNLGLIGVHLKRYVSNLSQPRHDREREDLFQEGCIGLIQAARTHREESGIPFAAFALPRIHNAVSRALRTRFHLVRMAPPRRDRRVGSSQTTEREAKALHPTRHSLTDAMGFLAADRHQPDSPAQSDPSHETIGQRVREKYERAVHTSRTSVGTRASIRGDRDRLVRLLADERFLIPHEESKRPLRQIARDTKSSYARVSQCNTQLADTIRKTLDEDPEFGELRRRAKMHPLGLDAPIDDELEETLVQVCASEYVRRFSEAGGLDRARMLQGLLEDQEMGVDKLVRRTFLQLSKDSRQRLLRDAPSDDPGREKRDPRRSASHKRPKKRALGETCCGAS